MKIRVIDFETTGMPPDAAVCEVGWSDVIFEDGLTQILPAMGKLTNPGRPMPIEAMAIHHIQDHELTDAPSPDFVFGNIAEGVDVFCAHNAAFERAFFTGAGKPWICTYKCGLRAWPDAPSHSNQALRYFLKHEIPAELAMPPHRAAPDAYVTAHTLWELLQAHPIANLMKWTSEPALLVKCGFGKHRGAKWEAVPSDYLDWLLRQKDMDADIHHTARHHLKLRAPK